MYASNNSPANHLPSLILDVTTARNDVKNIKNTQAKWIVISVVIVFFFLLILVFQFITHPIAQPICTGICVTIIVGLMIYLLYILGVFETQVKQKIENKIGSLTS